MSPGTRSLSVRTPAGPPAAPQLPGVLARFAEVAGLEAALKIAEARGGTRIYIPGRLPQGHWLVATVGPEAALKIARDMATNHGGDYVLVPMGPHSSSAQRWRRMRQMFADGHSRREIAAACGVHERTVQMHRNRVAEMPRVKAQTDQLPLL